MMQVTGYAVSTCLAVAMLLRDYLAVMQSEIDMSQLFGWIQTVLTQLGIWSYLQAFLMIAVVVASAAALLRMLGVKLG